MKPYTEEIEHLMKTMFFRLSEKDRRRYAAVEAQKLGWGGKEYISNVVKHRLQEHLPGAGRFD